MQKKHRIKEVYREVVDLIDAGRSFALATILQAVGSTPRRTGVKAVIDADGRISGTLSGGRVEARAQQLSVKACRSGEPVIFDMRLDGDSAAADGSICGGSVRILVDPTVNKNRTPFVEAAEALSRRKRGVLVTRVRNTDQPDPAVTVRWFSEECLSSGAEVPDGQTLAACLAKESPHFFVADSHQTPSREEVLIEPIIPRPVLLIAGAGHIGQALARQGVLIGFDVTVIDDRDEFADARLFPQDVTICCGDIPTQVKAAGITEETYIVLVTRGHKLDAEVLEACIHTPCAYIGMIASKRKATLVRTSFIESGIATEEEFDRVSTPVGLDIGAVTVPEIAISIASELIAVRREARVRSAKSQTVLR